MGTFQNYSGTPDYGMGSASPWSCPLDETATPPTQSRWATCGDNNHAAPSDATKTAQNPYAKILSTGCFVRIWEKLLQIPVSSVAFPNQCTPLYQVLAHYGDESKNSIAVTLMNEPNMVDTADLADAYRQIVTLLRGPKFKLPNRLLLMGNYWGGLHAQANPRDRSNSTCGALSTETQGHTDPSQSPIQVIHEAISSVANLGKWTYDVHQYFDFFSTGNFDCDQVHAPRRVQALVRLHRAPPPVRLHRAPHRVQLLVPQEKAHADMIAAALSSVGNARPSRNLGRGALQVSSTANSATESGAPMARWI